MLSPSKMQKYWFAWTPDNSCQRSTEHHFKIRPLPIKILDKCLKLRVSNGIIKYIQSIKLKLSLNCQTHHAIAIIWCPLHDTQTWKVWTQSPFSRVKHLPFVFCDPSNNFPSFPPCCNDTVESGLMHEYRPVGRVAGDDSDEGWLGLADGGGVGAQALLLHQVLRRHNALIVLHLLSILFILNNADVLGHLFELVRQPLTLDLGKDATLVVISTPMWQETTVWDCASWEHLKDPLPLQVYA